MGKPPATYEDYRRIFLKYKETYGNQVAVFYQVGSFYELYDVVSKSSAESWCNVKEVIDILGIQLSIKSESDQNEELLFAGFPDYTLHRWASKLTQNGWTVVVVDQKKDSKGKVETREVSRILSPGTHSEYASATESPYVASIWLEENINTTPCYGISTLDLTTGFSASYEGQTRGKHTVWSADEAVHFFQIHNPREVILYWRGDNFSQPSEGSTRRIFGLAKQPIHFRSASTSQQGSLEIPLVREEFLKKHFQPQTLLPVREYLHIAKKPIVERSLCCLLRFMEDHFSMASQLKNHIPWNPDTTLQCGNNALAQLNFVGENIGDCILGLFSKCITPMGKRAIRKRLLSPLTNKDAIQIRLERVGSFMDTSTQNTVEQSLCFMFDLPRLHRKIMNFTISGGDVVALYQTYKEILNLRGKIDAKLFSETIPKIEDLETVMKAWSAVFSKEKAEKANENLSFISPGISPEIDTLEAKIQAIYSDVSKWLTLFESPELRIEEKDKIPITIRGTKQAIQSIKLKTATSSLGKMYENLEFRQTKSVGNFVEAPFLERANERILSLRSQLSDAITAVLPKICIEFFEKCGQGIIWQTLEEFVEEIDCSLCIAKVSKERGFYKPTIIDNTEGSSINAQNLRHPLIESLATRTKYVSHDVSLDSKSYGWLLYGMNASGKSSLMKAIGIAVLLAQCGSYVPATSMVLAPFERLLTRILNVDNLWAGLSSFAVEVSELRDIFLRADNKTLVLGDELCSGTESVSATALVAAGISYLLRKQSRFVFATHYHDLFKLPAIREAESKGLAIWHLKVRYDIAQDILVYERTLSPGPGSTTYGIEVARALGMPFEVLDEAMKYRRTLQGEKKEEELSPSSWNKNIIVRKCEECGSEMTRDLEVHHIRPRAEAVSNHFMDGSSRDSERNLMVVCNKCHDAHHAGKIDITPLVDTSIGQQRTLTPPKPVSNKKVPTKDRFSSEQIGIIQKTIAEFPNFNLKMLRFKLMDEFQIIISEGALRTLQLSKSD